MVGPANILANSYTTSKEINHPHYNVTESNEQHQFDILYMPYNLFEGNTYKYILTDIDVAPRYKVARPLKTKKNKRSCIWFGSNLLKRWSFQISQSISM